MTVIPKLASSLNRRDEVPNIELAKEIVKKGDKKAVKELVENLIIKAGIFKMTVSKSSMKLGN